jgi:hypothetical protein
VIRFVDAKVSNDAVGNLFCSRRASTIVHQAVLLMVCGQPLQERYETTYFAPFKVGVALCMHNHADCDHILRS